jgi:hypothetical protein
MTEKEKAKVNEIMRLLDCTEEEAIDVIETDKIIDKGGRTKYDLSKEQEKVAMKISAVNDRRAKDKENNQRGKVRVENPTKENIIAELSQFLAENSQNGVENVEIVNKSKLITFQIGEKSFKLDLIEQRKKKN